MSTEGPSKSKTENAKEGILARNSAIVLVFIGFVIFLVSLLLVWTSENYSSALFKGLNLETSAQFGDYIGGLVGAFWTLAGVLLFYSALKIQQKEFKTQRDVLDQQKEELKLQRKEFANHRREFAISRITETIHQQRSILLERINDLHCRFTIYNDQEENRLDSVPHHTLNHELKQFEGINLVKAFGALHSFSNAFDPVGGGTEEWRNHLFHRSLNFDNSPEVAAHIVFLDQTLNLFLSMINESEIKSETSSESEYVLTDEQRKSLKLLLTTNIFFAEHWNYINAFIQVNEHWENQLSEQKRYEELNARRNLPSYRMHIFRRILKNLKILEKSID